MQTSGRCLGPDAEGGMGGAAVRESSQRAPLLLDTGYF